MNKSYLSTQLFFSCFAVYLLMISSCRTSFVENSPSSMTIAFGSCNHHWEVDQPIWDEILKNQPDHWIWLGDIIYSDTEDMSKMQQDYFLQKNNNDYKRMLSETKIIGIWDDHDYGVNDGGKGFIQKDSSKLLLFDFLSVPRSDPAWTRNGAYQSYIYHKGDLSVKIILLDVRYFRDPVGHPNGSILGEDQWKWLEQELRNSASDIHLIGGGIQFLPEDHRFEKWANFPSERSKLIGLLDELSVANPILISGDRHIGEMSLVALPSSQTPLLEITSSGLTHAYTGFTSEENRHRIGKVLPFKNFGTLTISKAKGKLSYQAELRNEENEIQYKVSKQELFEKLK